jgi:hypothetical protein
MFIQVLGEKGNAFLKGDYFTITPKIGPVYEFAVQSKGKMSVLHKGSYESCVKAAADFVDMTYEFVD